MSNADVRGLLTRLAFIPAVGCLLIGRPPPAAAQEAAARQQDSGALTEVVVTVQFRRENAQDTPIALSALDAQAMAARGMNNVADAANSAPSVTIAPAASGFGQSASITIRGVGQADPHLAVEPGVGMYIDDVYYGMLSGSVFELLDADRVEVLRGPQGTTEGKNSIGGSIKLFSKTPGPEPDAFVEAGYGDYNHYVVRAASNVTLIADSLYARVSAGTLHQDGYLTELDYTCATGLQLPFTQPLSGSKRTGTDCKIGEEGGKSMVTARASVRWIANSNVEDLLIGDVTQDHSENPAGKLLFQSPSWTGGANFITGPHSYTNYENNLGNGTGSGATYGPTGPYVVPNTSPLDAWGVSNNLDIGLPGDLNLRSITAYRSEHTVFAQQTDASPANLANQLWSMRTRQFTQELRLLGSIGKLADWTVGVFYYNASGFSSGRINLPGGFAPGGGGLDLDFLLDDPVHTRSASGFAHVVLHPVEKLNVTLAGRYTSDLKAFTFNRLGLDFKPYPPLASLVGVTGTYKGTRWDYRAAVDYQWTDSFMTYADVATGYKGGGINPRPYFVSQVQRFNPETLLTYEVGMKSEFLDHRARVNLSAYFSKYGDIQLMLLQCDQFSPFPGAPCAMTANVGDAHVKGVELEAQVRATQQLSFNASFGYTDFQYTRTDPSSGVMLGMQNVYAPKTTASGGVQYAIDLPNGSTITPRLDYNYRSQIWTSAVNAPTNRLAGVGLANARITWEDPTKEWEASMSITNLTDKFYYASLGDDSGAPYFALWAQPGPPRMYLVSLKRSF
ncbi:MAG TPA: TonB-dependent receptor [Steroidobacteraceae bacterium]|jgi:iron complex outermembrane receptor protein